MCPSSSSDAGISRIDLVLAKIRHYLQSTTLHLWTSLTKKSDSLSNTTTTTTTKTNNNNNAIKILYHYVWLDLCSYERYSCNSKNNLFLRLGSAKNWKADLKLKASFRSSISSTDGTFVYIKVALSIWLSSPLFPMKSLPSHSKQLKSHNLEWIPGWRT